MVVKGRLVLTVCLYFQLRQPIPLDFNPITAVKVKLFVLILETIVETLEISETSSPIAAIADSAQLIPPASLRLPQFLKPLLAPHFLPVQIFQGQLDVFTVLYFSHPLQHLHGNILPVDKLLAAQVQFNRLNFPNNHIRKTIAGPDVLE